MKTFYQIINWLGLLLFGYFASLQINDANPLVYYHASNLDAYLWLAFYVVLAVVFLLAVVGRIRQWMPVAVAVFCVIQLAMTAPGFIENLSSGGDFTLMGSQMSPEKPRVELSREFLGALIGLVGMVLVWLQTRGIRTSEENGGQA